MTEKHTKIPIKSIKRLNKSAILEVSIILTKEFKIRTCLAVWLIRLATKILNCAIKINIQSIYS